MKLIKNNNGFAHPVLLVLLLVGVIGVVAYSGHKVLNSNKTAQNTAGNNQLAEVSDAGNLGAETATEIKAEDNISAAADKTSGSLASNKKSASDLTETKNVTTTYDLTTPVGSLNHTLAEIKAKRFSNVLYFITPRMMFRVQDLLGTEDISQISKKCSTNTGCKNFMAMKMPELNNHYTEDCKVESISATCKTLVYYLKVDDKKLTTTHHKDRSNIDFTVRIEMLETSTNWVINKVKINDYTL